MRIVAPIRSASAFSLFRLFAEEGLDKIKDDEYALVDGVVCKNAGASSFSDLGWARYGGAQRPARDKVGIEQKLIGQGALGKQGGPFPIS